MRELVLLGAVGLVCSAATVAVPARAAPPAGEAQETAKAVEAARAWLALVDSGKYGDSWEKAAAFFRKAVPKKTWTAQVGGVREPLGAVLERKLKSATFTRELPGAPDGSYVVIQFETRFAGKRSAVETVTPMLDPDGVWRVSGYYIR